MGVYPQKKARFYTYICINRTHLLTKDDED